MSDTTGSSDSNGARVIRPQLCEPKNREEWLDSIYISNADASTMRVREYLKTTDVHDQVFCFWQDVHIDWALEFIRRRHAKHTDVYIAHTSLGEALYKLGVDPQSLPATDSQIYQDMWKSWKTMLETPDVVIIPVNNGYIERELASKTVTEGVAEKDKPQNQAGYVPNPGRGAHWSFIVIDRRNKEQPTARYVDGMVRATRNSSIRRNVWNISGIDINGRPAGKVLCGFDTLLGLEKGKIDARTLKFVPHQYRDDNYTSRDNGACGPHMYALMEHMLASKKRLIDPGLDAAFNTAASRQARANELQFNSNQTRAEFARELMEERRRFELLQPRNSVDNLTPEVLRSILTIDKLVGLAHLPSGQPPRPGKNKGTGNGGGGGGDGGGDDQTFGDPPIPITILDEYIRAHPEISKAAKDNNEKYKYAHSMCMEDQKNGLRDNEEKNKKNKENGEVSNGPHDLQWVKRYPAGFDATNLPDFASLSSVETLEWGKLYTKDLLGQIPSKGYSYLTARPLMHATYKGTFGKETKKVLLSHVEDPHAFDYADKSVKKWKREDIIARLDQTYVTLDIPFFATLSDDEVDHWVANLHPVAYELVRDADGKILHGKARGLLYRMFVGSFDDMSAQDITKWAKADPSIPEKHKANNEAALIIMKILYHGRGTEHLPYLRRSPLHWPDRKWRDDQRTKRGEKRKRDSSGNDEDEDSDHASSGKRAKTTKDGSAEDTSLIVKLKVTVPAGHLKDSKPTDTPKPTEDPKTINWAAITDVELEKYLTPTILQDPRVGENANKYTYRAILFLQHDGTFKDDSQKKQRNLWIRDTNVFTPGLEEDVNADLVLQEDGHFEIRPMADIILARMAARYEPVSTPTATQDAPKRTRLAILEFPENITALPQDFADAKEVPKVQLDRWATANDDRIKSLFLSSKKNDLSVRAALQVLSGVDFKKEFRDRLETIWIHDPEVFTPEDRESKMPFGGIGLAMSAKYDVFGMSELDPEKPNSPSNKPPNKPSNDSNTPTKPSNGANKRKRSATDSSPSDSSSPHPPTKKPKRSAPNFLTVPESKLALWLEHLDAPLPKLLRSKNDASTVANPTQTRWALERIFNSTFQRMQSEDEMSDATLKTLGAWKFRSGDWTTLGSAYVKTDKRGMRGFLEKVLMADKVGGVKVVWPDHRGDEGKWPEYYRRMIAEEERDGEGGDDNEWDDNEWDDTDGDDTDGDDTDEADTHE